MKKFLRKSIDSFANVLGIEVAFARKKHNTSYDIIDQNTLEPCWQRDRYLDLYYEGLERSSVTETDNFFKQCRHYMLQQMVQHVMEKGVTGDVVECGCWKGHSSFLIASILDGHGFSGEFSIFDSFEGGLSDKSVEDANARVAMDADQVAEEKQHFASTEDQLHYVLKPFSFYKLYKGWIPDRFSEVEERRFAFVHIDVDLYQPILDALEFFYPRMDRGGVIVVDDFGFTQFPGAKASVQKFLDENSCEMTFASLTGGCVIIK